MNSRRITVILIAIAFGLITLFSCVGLLSVKKVEVVYAVSDETESEEIQNVLDGYLGRNLMFLDTDEVVQSLKGYPYMEVLSVDKRFPNVLSVELKERREVYYIEYGEKVYITTAEGFVLNSFDKNVFSGNVARDKIMLTLTGVSIEKIKTGSVIKTDNDEFVTAVFDMAKSVNLTDCIKSISVTKNEGDFDYDVVFDTYTGVKMCIENVPADGKEKTLNAFKIYDEFLSDFQKTFGEIQSYRTYEGIYRVTYEQKLVWTSGN